jgi:hypothetical protein
MTDRIKGVYVAFDTDIHEDDCEPLIGAIRMIRGVAAVTTMVTEPADWMNRERATREIEKRIWDALRPGEREVLERIRGG